MNQEQRATTNRVIAHAQRQVWITFRKEGIHKYPAALTDPALADVQFLGYPHRHIFHFRVWLMCSTTTETLNSSNSNAGVNRCIMVTVPF